MFKLNRISIFVVALLAVALFASAAPALAAGLSIDPHEGSYADTFTVQADGFSPNEKVSVWVGLLDGTTVGLDGTSADSTGSIDFSITPDESWHPGQVVVVAHGQHSGREYSATFHLVRETTSTNDADSASAWTGEYFSNMDLSGAPILVREDAAVNFNWGTGSPSAEIPVDNFSVRWGSTRNVAEAGNYTITATGDDGIRVWVDNQLVINAWYDQSATTYSAMVYLEAGQHSFTVEYYENTVDAVVAVDIVRD